MTNRIYISTACFGNKDLFDTIDVINTLGYSDIELSGGAGYKPNCELIHGLKQYQDKGINFIFHNYAPAPEKPFVLNLASEDIVVANKSIAFLKNSLDISKELGIKKYGFHAGYFLDIPVQSLGKKIQVTPYNNKKRAYSLFIERYKQVESYAVDLDVKLYLENNVYGFSNYKRYGDLKPLMLLDYNDYMELTREISFKFILDVAHLKATCNSLNLNFVSEISKLYKESDYIHISDNNGLEDSNHPLCVSSELYDILKQQDHKGKSFTIEVYRGEQAVQETYAAIQRLLNED